MGKSLSEARREERKPVKVIINYRTIDQFFSEIGTNLSTGGVFVKSPNPLPIGTEIKISFNIPQFDCYLETMGVVVHNGTAENPGMGIKFKNLTDRAKKILTDVLEHELLPPGDDIQKKINERKTNARITVKVESKPTSDNKSTKKSSTKTVKQCSKSKTKNKNSRKKGNK